MLIFIGYGCLLSRFYGIESAVYVVAKEELLCELVRSCYKVLRTLINIGMAGVACREL